MRANCMLSLPAWLKVHLSILGLHFVVGCNRTLVYFVSFASASQFLLLRLHGCVVLEPLVSEPSRVDFGTRLPQE